MARSAVRLPVLVEMSLAFAVGAAWFAFSAFAIAPLQDSPVVTSIVVVVDVVLVLAIAHYWDIPYAVTFGVASVVALDWYYIPPTHATGFPDVHNLLALLAYLLMGSLLGELAVRARRRAILSERARSELADEQAALRRVATMVARETPPGAVFAAITEEVGLLLDIDLATMLRYETDRTATVVAAWSRTGRLLEVDARLSLEGENVASLVLDSAAPARIDNFDNAAGPLSARLRAIGVRSSVGSPISVAGNVWGVMVASSQSDELIAGGLQTRLEEFTELAATAVANAQSRSELRASRARIVAASDETRRRIERDLHDGLQQRLVSLALRLRLAGADVKANAGTDLTSLDEVGEGLVEAVDELRELSRGIHPAILAEGGLRPALATLARRSAVPVELEVNGPDRLPEHVEVALYYVVSEFLTNTAKYAQASVVTVTCEADDSSVRLTARDDGVGGAEPGSGSGLAGLGDRVHALGGSLQIVSPPGEGTTAVVTLPLVDPAGASG